MRSNSTHTRSSVTHTHTNNRDDSFTKAADRDIRSPCRSTTTARSAHNRKTSSLQWEDHEACHVKDQPQRRGSATREEEHRASLGHLRRERGRRRPIGRRRESDLRAQMASAVVCCRWRASLRNLAKPTLRPPNVTSGVRASKRTITGRRAKSREVCRSRVVRRRPPPSCDRTPWAATDSDQALPRPFIEPSCPLELCTSRTRLPHFVTDSSLAC